MRDYNKIFQTMASILENGEYILRQTARKMEKEINPLLNVKVEQAGVNTTDLKFEKVVRNDFNRTVLITKDNIKQIFDWLYTHPGIISVYPGDTLWNSIVFTAHEDGVTYTAKIGYRIIEEFDGADFYIYPSDSGDFERNFHIIKE